MCVIYIYVIYKYIYIYVVYIYNIYIYMYGIGVTLMCSESSRYSRLYVGVQTFCQVMINTTINTSQRRPHRQ